MRSHLCWSNLVCLSQKQGSDRLSPTFMETCAYQMGLGWFCFRYHIVFFYPYCKYRDIHKKLKQFLPICNYYHKIQNGFGKSPNSDFLTRIACKSYWRICGDLPPSRLHETERESPARAGRAPEALGRGEGASCFYSWRCIGNILFKEMGILAMRSPLCWSNLVCLSQKQGSARLSPTFMETCTCQMGLVWVDFVFYSKKIYEFYMCW